MNRVELQNELCDVIGSKNVYYQPPSSYKITYPCIVYELSNKKSSYANNHTYKIDDRYTVTFIHKDADSDIPNKILNRFTMISHDRTFKNDNLYHDVFSLYY